MFFLIAVALFYGTMLIQTGFNFAGFDLVSFVIFVAIFYILLSCTSLQVVVDGKFLRIMFAYRMFRKQFLLKEIVSAKTVKNHWYYGWGIRLWLWPFMWIYNVSGFDAVEIVMKNGKKYRIGTDEPQKLQNAIVESMK